MTFGRYIKSDGSKDFVPLSTPTPGAANAAPRVSPVVINEVMYHPDRNVALGVAGSDEYVELYNLTAAPVPLYDPAHPENPWKFLNGITYAFPAGTRLRLKLGAQTGRWSDIGPSGTTTL